MIQFLYNGMCHMYRKGAETMGLFDFFKKQKTVVSKQEPETPTVPETEKKYYQNDSYYNDIAFSGTSFEKRVISFEERKHTAIPSRTGLYPAEILLLEYCSYGTYPGPKNGYPGFWWFEYGIRDVGAALKSPEDRGYIVFATAKESLDNFTVPQLKELLSSKDLPTSGKKADLIMRVTDAFSEAELLATGVQIKYILTGLGQRELTENEYVPYMHKAHNKTTEDDRLGMTFNVWSINKLLGTGDKTNWKTVVEEQEKKMEFQIAENNVRSMEILKKVDPQLFKKQKAQDQQLKVVQSARKEFNESKDINSYIAFWEMLWKNGGLLFRGSMWHFELADLYIAAKKYNDALCFVKKLKMERKEYADKADSYIAKIEKLVEKQSGKK